MYSQELVLRDNKLKKIPDSGIFKNLLVFDVSFNEITSLHGLSKVSNTLKELYVSKNEVTKIEEIDHLYQLQILELGSNRLRVSSPFLLNHIIIYPSLRIVGFTIHNVSM
jgi:protein phosphatase 1 regulatory subunit 7